MRTSEDVLRQLRAGKERLREQRRARSLPEKVREVVELQKIELKMIERRRPLSERERVWPIRTR